jgi:DNA-binding MarR family transcriptional regulator
VAKNRRPVPFAFTPIHNHFVEFQLRHISHSELAVYLVLMRFTWGHGKQSDTIAQSQIMSMAGLSKSAVAHAVLKLKAKGMIEVNGALRRVRTYEVLLPKRNNLVMLQCASDTPPVMHP